MRIGGLQPFSLSDFPGRVAAIVFTQGCNFRCPFCHNASLWRTESDSSAGDETSVESALDFLRSRADRLGGVVVSGGEPTIHDDLPAFLSSLRAMGLAVKLDTNGGRPDMLARVFSAGLVDYVAMDIKAPLDYYDRLAGVAVPRASIADSIRLIAESGVAHHFRTTWTPQLMAPEDRARILALVPRGSSHVWQEFRPELAADQGLNTPLKRPA